VALKSLLAILADQAAELKWQHHAVPVAELVQAVALKSLLAIHAVQLHLAIADVV